MKIIHLSDPHIYTDKINGIDPVDRFKKALAHIIEHHQDADLFTITGDITDLGDKESYQLFLSIVNDFNLPNNLEPQIIIGNHDNREIFKENFTSIKLDEKGFIQYFKDLKNKRFIFIDTNLANTHAGHYCEDRQRWLKNILSQTSYSHEIYIFMHHNPIALVKDSSDGIGLQQKDQFKNVSLNIRLLKNLISEGHKFIKNDANLPSSPKGLCIFLLVYECQTALATCSTG